jgi:NAD(P)H dehydrogenase (quinone)
MGKLLVTGATGNLGRLIVQGLLEKEPASRVVGLARDPAQAADLTSRGVEIRQGDYFDYESLVRAFADVDRILLVSTHAFTDRNTQHFAVIAAAKQAGVRHVIFTAIQRGEDSDHRQVGITEGDIFAEQALKASGLTYTILRQPMFLEEIAGYIGPDAYQNGVRVPDGPGTVAPVLRRDLAAASVAVLTQDGHENATYTLSGSEAATFRDIAATLTEIHGAEVPYVPITANAHTEGYIKQGIPQHIAEFLTSWVTSIAGGAFSENTGDLERLIDYRPTSYRDFLTQHYPLIRPASEKEPLPTTSGE